MDGKLTLIQRKFIKACIQMGNATQAAKDAGYECKTDAAYAEMGSRLVRKKDGFDIGDRRYREAKGLFPVGGGRVAVDCKRLLERSSTGKDQKDAQETGCGRGQYKGDSSQSHLVQELANSVLG